MRHLAHVVGNENYRGWKRGFTWLETRIHVVGNECTSDKPFIYNTIFTTNQPQSY